MHAWNGFLVQEPVRAIEHPRILLKHLLILALEHLEQLLQIDRLGSGWLKGAVRETPIPLTLVIEDLSVVHESFLLHACPPVSLGHVGVNKIFPQQREHHCSHLVQILQEVLVIDILENVEYLLYIRWLSKDILSILNRLENWIDIEIWQTDHGPAHLISISASANCSTHIY